MCIYKKIQAVMQAVKGVGKDSKNQHANYKYASHDAVTEVLRHQFAEIGIIRHATVGGMEVLDGGTVQLWVKVSYIDTEDGTSIDTMMPAIQPSQTKAGTLTAQQIGQALSYAVKNVEFKLFCLVGDPEADSDSLPIQHPCEPRNPKLSKVILSTGVVSNGGDVKAMSAKLADDLRKLDPADTGSVLSDNRDFIDCLPQKYRERLVELANQVPTEPEDQTLIDDDGEYHVWVGVDVKRSFFTSKKEAFVRIETQVAASTFHMAKEVIEQNADVLSMMPPEAKAHLDKLLAAKSVKPDAS